ncbi:MAG: hypothetical protein VW082_12405 [Candidatus Nanopelagicales bacterium]
MRSLTIATVVSAVAVSSLASAPAAQAAAGTVQVTVDVAEEVIAATASANMPYTDFLVHTTHSGSTAQVTIQVDPDGEGSAQLWSATPGCPAVPQSSPVMSMTCTIDVPVTGQPFALIDFGATTGGSQLAVLQGSTLPVEFVGGTGSDYFQGASADETANGGPGDDFLFGGPGADTLDGGPGDDRVEGEEGRDVMVGGTGVDEILAADGEADALVQCGEEDSDVLVATDAIETDPTLDFVNGCYGLGSLTAPTDLAVTVDDFTGAATWAGGSAATYQLVYRTEGEVWQDGGRWAGTSGKIEFPKLPGTYEVGVAKVTDDAVSELSVVVDVEVGDGVPPPRDVEASALCYPIGRGDYPCDYALNWVVPLGAAEAGIVAFTVQYRRCEDGTCWWIETSVEFSGSTAMTYRFEALPQDRMEMRVRSVTADGVASRWVATYVDPEAIQSPSNVDALASASAMQVTWTPSNLRQIGHIWPHRQYVEVQYLRPGGRTSSWSKAGRLDYRVTKYRFAEAPKGATMRFRVSVLEWRSAPSPWRQATDSVPQPRDPKANYKSNKLTVSWTSPTKGVKLWDSDGAVNVRGYQIQVRSGGSWETYPVQPVSGSRDVISMRSDPGSEIRLRLVAWPGTSESRWVSVKVKAK